MGQSPRKRSPQAWQQGGGGAGGPSRKEAAQKWKQVNAETPAVRASGNRRMFIGLFLFTGLLFLVGGVFLLIYLLRAPARPLIVPLAANPAEDVERLNVPVDHYGWLAAQQIIAQTQAMNAKSAEQKSVVVAPDISTGPGGTPMSLPTDESGLRDWADKLNDRKYDPVIIYAGLPTGVGPDGPFLWVGKGGKLPLKTLIDTLSKHLTSKNKILILDPGRLPPDAIHGQLHDDFARRLKEMNGTIKDCPNLLVFCGAGPGEVAWDSEERQTTAFAYFLQRGLAGEAAKEEDPDMINARQLFEFTRDSTQKWTQANRPTAQTPFLLPEGEEGLALARGMKTVVRQNPIPAAPAPSATFTIPAQLVQRWTDHDRMRDAVRPGLPGAASYTPRAWRRYRELLLRYEQAIRAEGPNSPSAEILNRSLSELDQIIATVPADPTPWASTRNSLALGSLLNRGSMPPPPAGLDLNQDPSKVVVPVSATDQAGYIHRVLQMVTGDGADGDASGFAARLNRSAPLLGKIAPDQRPIEAHLPVMVDHFYRTIANQNQEEIPGSWAKLIISRRQAERAALGLGDGPLDPAGPTAMSEQVWDHLSATILDADRLRREAEDRSFGTANPANEENQAGTAARTEYRRATAAAIRLRQAIATRDQVQADLPFLARYIATRAHSLNDPFVEKIQALGDAVLQLAQKLDDPSAAGRKGTDLDRYAAECHQAVEKIQADYQALLAEFQKEYNQQRSAVLQVSWATQQQLLTAPLIPADKRMAILKEVRSTSATLLTSQNKQQPGVTGTAPTATDARDQAAIRASFALAELGREVIDQVPTSSQLPRFEALAEKVRTLRTTPADQQGKWADIAVEAGVAFEGHYQRIGGGNPPPSYTLNPLAERQSRVGVRLERDDSWWEPAAVHHRVRWSRLLTALARRTADDHWYDEKFSPTVINAPIYYRTATERYLADSTLVVSPITPKVTVPDRSPEIVKLLATPPLTVPTYPNVNWTSERDRVIELDKMTLPGDYPVKGLAVVVPRLEGGYLRPRTADELTKRIPKPIDAGAALPVNLTLEVPAADEEKLSLEGTVTVKATVYFRGQQPTESALVKVNRRPEIIVSEPLPVGEERGVAVAVQADKELDIGAVAILLDLSGSMMGDLEGKAIPGGNWRGGNSKFRQAIDALRDILKDLPHGTPLRVRVFAEKSNPTGSKLVYPDGAVPAQVTWRPGNLAPLDALIDKLNALDPDGFTPLVDSIVTAAKEDLGNNLGRPQTLIVLTDGIDQNAPMLPTAAQMVDKQQLLTAEFKEPALKNVGLHIVQFGINPVEVELGKILFAKIGNHNIPGAVWQAGDKDKLRQALLDALWPKLQLVRKAGGGIPSDGWPRMGWPARPATASRQDLYWSPHFDAAEPNGYSSQAEPSGLRTPFDFFPKDGERFILRFKKGDQPGRVSVTRSLYADFFEGKGLSTRRESDQAWALTVPTTWIKNSDPPLFNALAMLEQVPGKGVNAGEQLAIQNPRPDLLWWDVTPNLKDTIARDGTLKITRLHAYPAPAYRVEVENWAKNPSEPGRYASPKIHTWATESARPSPAVECPTDGTPIQARVGDQEVTVRANLEPQPIGPMGGRINALVLRVQHAQGQEVVARLRGGVSQDRNAEHRYYQKSGSYTAMFGPFPAGQAKVSVEFLPVSAVKRDESRLELKLPPPEVGTGAENDYRLLKARPTVSP